MKKDRESRVTDFTPDWAFTTYTANQLDAKVEAVWDRFLWERGEAPEQHIPEPTPEGAYAPVWDDELEVVSGPDHDVTPCGWCGFFPDRASFENGRSESRVTYRPQAISR